MKLYKNLVNAIAQTTHEIMIKGRYADKAIERLFKSNPQWGSRDRRFVAEAVYDIVRNYRLYATLAESENNFWFITAVWLVLKQIEIPDWQEFKHLDKNFIINGREQLKSNLPVYESYPDWLWNLGVNELGKDLWEKESLSMNVQAPVFLRVNTLKTTVKDLAAKLLADKIETNPVEHSPVALKLTKRENIFQNRLFKEGMFEVQDAGSQRISEFLNPVAGETVIDACAGAGGKSLHLAALMKNKGRVISMDVEDWKLEELKKRARRAGAFNIEPRLIEGDKTIKSLEKKADKLLLDVPCSGLGVLRRNPDAKWKLNQNSFNETKKTQAAILSKYASMVKPNGTMVYSTCSILPSENNLQVKAFLASNPNYELQDELTLLPSEGFDGFYMARLKCKS